MSVDDRLRRAATELRMATSDRDSWLELRRRRRWPIPVTLGLAIAVAAAVIAVSTSPDGRNLVSVGSPSARTSPTIDPARLGEMKSRLARYMQVMDMGDRLAAMHAGHPEWWYGSTVTSPVLDAGKAIAVAVFSWDPVSPVLVLSYAGGRWVPVAHPADPWCPCQGSPPKPSSVDPKVPIQVGDVTGDGRPDFLISMTAAGTTPGAVLSQDGAAPGQWRYIPFSGQFPTTTKVGGSPSIQGDHVISTFDSCQPTCALGKQWRVTWTYQPASGQFTSSAAYSLLPGSPTPPDDVGQLQAFGPESATSWWAVVRGSVDGSAYLVRTADSGQTWQNVYAAGGQPISASVFLNPDTAWVAIGDQATNPPLYRTTDAGRSWQRVGSDPGGCNLDFVDLLHGWCIDIGAAAGSETVRLLRTTDGGTSWTQVSSTEPPGGRSSTPGSLPYGCDKSITFTSDTVGWANGYCDGGDPYLYRTLDAGAHWYPLPKIPLPAGTPPSEGSGLGEPAVEANDLAVVESINGPQQATVIATSSDSGRRWRSQLVTNTNQAWNADLIDPTHWRLTDGTEMMATDDAGAHWRTWTPAAGLKGLGTFGNADTLKFLTPLEGWALPGADGGPLWWTEDGGVTWKAVKILAGPYVFPP